MPTDSQLAPLIDRVLEIRASDENAARADKWAPQPYWARDHWRGVPRGADDGDGVPFTVEPENAFWAHILGFDIGRYYADPRTFLQVRLRMSIYRFEHFDDHTVIGDDIPIWFGVPFEMSLFGMPSEFTAGNDPWIGRQPVVSSLEDVACLEPIDFRTSGLMPHAHRFHTELCELADGRLQVTFPEWGRGPMGVACQLRGMEQFLADMHEQPELVHALMRAVTDARIQWTQERADYLGQGDPGAGNLYNDCIGSETLSPSHYEEFVLPDEVRLGQFHGAIAYWHSCGSTEDFAPLVARLPKLTMYHVGPHTDVRKVREALGADVALEVCLDPVADVQMGDPTQMQARIRDVVEAATGGPLTIRADGLQLLNGLQDDLAKIQEFIDAAKVVLGE
ncbi:MAG: uroporphyrinogen decarboxylase family protein [Armatimonadota bacterium]